MSKTDRYIKRYGLKIVKIEKTDLTKLRYQFRPETDEDRLLINFPHFELANLYYSHGLEWLKKNFNKTKYSLFQKNILLKDPNIPMRKIHLFDSLKGGYLKKGYENDYIVILNEPLITTRYGVNIKPSLPEIFMGHHRAAALLALGEKKVDVIIASDDNPNTRYIYGNLHDIYKDIKVK